jgi:ABC-2 type transport system permease protein
MKHCTKQVIYVALPMMLISGVFFSYHNFPDKLIPFLQKLPLTMVADSMRSIFIEGAGFAQVGLPIIVLTAGHYYICSGFEIFQVVLRAGCI